MKLHVSRRFVLALFAAVLLPPLGACATSLQWTEDVKLPDGRIVPLTRHQEFQGVHELFQPPTESDYWLAFKNPDNGQRVRWDGHRDLGTVALLMDKGMPELLMRPWLGGYDKWNCPDPPYLLWRYEDKKWNQIPLAELRGMKIRPNLTTSPGSARADILAHGHHLEWQLAGGYVPGAFEQGTNIDFANLGTQTFGIHCNAPLNTMEERRGRK